MEKNRRTDAYVDGRGSVLAMPEQTFDDPEAKEALLKALSEEQHARKVARNAEIRAAHDTPPAQRTSDQRFCVGFTSRPNDDDGPVRPVSFYAYQRFRCRECGGMGVGGPRVVYCSNRCKEDSVITLRTPYRARLKESAPCSHCGETFIKARSDAKFCSGACRVAAHRAGAFG